MKMIVELSKGYQITIPAKIRKALNLKIGSPLELNFKKNKLTLGPIEQDIESMFKLAKSIKPKKKMTAEEMRALNDKLFR